MLVSQMATEFKLKISSPQLVAGQKTINYCLISRTEEIHNLKINDQLQSQYNQNKIKQLKEKFEKNVCSSFNSNFFWLTKS